MFIPKLGTANAAYQTEDEERGLVVTISVLTDVTCSQGSNSQLTLVYHILPESEAWTVQEEGCRKTRLGVWEEGCRIARLGVWEEGRRKARLRCVGGRAPENESWSAGGRVPENETWCVGGRVPENETWSVARAGCLCVGVRAARVQQLDEKHIDFPRVTQAMQSAC